MVQLYYLVPGRVICIFTFIFINRSTLEYGQLSTSTVIQVFEAVRLKFLTLRL